MKHERALPIVPNCRALVLRYPLMHENWMPLVGTEVAVLRVQRAQDGFVGWLIDSSLVRSLNGFGGPIVWAFGYLLRIDGDCDADESERKPEEINA